jgi:hypothetical protein
VLDVIRRERPGGLGQVSDARARATDSVAQELGIIEWTVRDKHTRQLNLTAEEFEELVWRWLSEGSRSLQEHLEANVTPKKKSQDLEAIRRFFEDRP